MIPGGRSVVVEVAILSGFVLFFVAARLASKVIRHSSFQSMGNRPARSFVDKLRMFDLDDALMVFNLALWTVVSYGIWVQILWGTNYVTPDMIVDWTPEDYRLATMGSKWALAMEVAKVSCVWGCKACLLILYFSMTKGLQKYQKAVIAVSVYVAIGYVIVISFLLGYWCRPINVYWQVPVPDDKSECSTYRKHMILDACLNITGDAVMLCLPIPLLIRAKLPRARKYALLAVFSLGGIVILCAVLNRITNFLAPFGSLSYLNWYAGETATAMIVTNVPYLWPLIARTFKLGSFSQNTTNNKSGFSMGNMKKGNSFNPVGSEERIAGDAQPQGSAYPEDKMDLTGKKGFSETNVFAGGWEDEELDSDGSSPKILKTVAVTQYRRDA
ncbi:hypothetical protein ONS95_001257 [Cadophora gregata]|uniref:uncharacterized protein n=2 Tax=Cadophora gregata TaxID=51156 RepID=UPI0026DC336D|nr:uncharacterized protein ONS95_001257 [Cadophora gregata]KAK0101932.1 hypothetical protein ONS96_005904 [Cadophora gregata f. sp. sojae]KAK0129326.1 hypothetical protein ONS95_001257 [Cadophora gregata]